MKGALADRRVLVGLGAAGILTGGGLSMFALPILLPAIMLSPVLQISIWWWLIARYLEKQRMMKVDAILKTFGSQYSRIELERLAKEDRKELNRLYKLASNEFFQKYVKEQADHKKAQELRVIRQIVSRQSKPSINRA